MSMNKTKSRLASTTMLTGALAAAFGIMPTGAAMAQDDTQDDTIVVTGSRLARPDLSAPSPTTVVGADAIANSGDVTIEQLLYEYPQLAAGQTSQVNNAGGEGILTANLRALGAERTLTLVNGRRFVPAGNAALTDLAAIPRSLVKRVEIITGGASAVYGSDAVAGAVNFILKDDFEGVEASYQYGQAFKGDGNTHTAELTVGGNFGDDRGNVVVYASYTNRDPVFMADREFSAISLDPNEDGEFIPFGSSNIPGTRLVLSQTQRDGLVGVDLSDTGPCTRLQGVRFGEGGAVLPYCQPENGYNFATLNYLMRPLEREQISGLASYDIKDNVEIYFEGHYINTRNAFQQAEESFGLSTPGLTDSVTGDDIDGVLITDYANNPVLPDPVRTFLVNNPQLFDIAGANYAGRGIIPNMGGAGDAIIEGTGRRGVETGPRNYDYERDAFAMTLGLRGEFEGLNSTWNWDVFGQYFRSRTDERTEGIYSDLRLSLGLDAVDDGAGGAVCRTQILGCVPVNPFGIGSITPEAGAFIATPRTSRSRFERQVVGASLTGELFEVPAGPVQAAFGFEYRRDQFDFVPGATDLSGEYGNGSILPTAGEYSLHEFFGETRIPILSAGSLINEFTIEGAIRYSEYSNFGGAKTWKVGAEWVPTDFIRFRAAYNAAFRAPTIGDLFSPIGREFSGGDDPCSVAFSPSAAVKAFCVAQGVPAGEIDTFTQLNTGFTAQTGGNPNVGPEKSRTLTVGAVIKPPIDNLNLTVDYYNIKVTDGIAAINAGTTVRTCYQLLDPTHPTCLAIDRSSTNGQVTLVRTQLDNQAQISVRGVDVQADYRVGLPSAFALADGNADLSFTALAGWLFERETIVTGALPIDCAGYFGGGCTGQTTFGIPDFKANFSTQYNSGPVSFRAGLRLIGSFDPFPTIVTAVPATGMKKYVDISANIQVNDNVELFGGIDNLFDVQPPLLGFPFGGDANTDVSVWDSIGRRFFLGARATF